MKKIKLLILNRRCIRHSQKGGAESYTWHIARSVVENGGEVEWFSSREKNLPSEEIIDEIKFIRKGNEITVHLYGHLYASKKDKSWIILDEFNGIGFFTHNKENAIILIHQLYEEFWNKEFGVLGYLFRILEKNLLKMYKNKKAITVSNSTKKDLLGIGFKDIKIILNGLDINPIENLPEKNRNLNLVYLGRIKKTKNPEDALKAFILIRDKFKDAQLHIIGEGPLLGYLKDKYGRIDGINFHGFLPEDKKYEILQRSHFLLVPSVREGWGQVVIQANAVGTPSIGYNVPGLRDSIVNGKTGFLVKDYKEMAEKVMEIYSDYKRYVLIAKNALEWSKNFSWKKTKEEFISFLKNLQD